MTLQLNLTYKSIQDIKPYKNNARIHDEKHISQIISSINTFNFTNPILIDENNEILAGHGRWLAAKNLNIENIPCIILDYLTEPQKKAYRITDNKLTINGSWDENLLGLELKDLSELDLDFKLDVMGFTLPEIDLKIQNFANGVNSDNINKNISEDPIDKFDSNIKETEIISKKGDIWQLGKHIIYCGDSLKQESFDIVMSLICDNKNKNTINEEKDKNTNIDESGVDNNTSNNVNTNIKDNNSNIYAVNNSNGKTIKARMIFTDPPYNVKITGHVCGSGKIKHDEFAMASGEMKQDEFIDFLRTIFINLKNYSVDGSLHYLCMDWRHIMEIMTASKDVYTEFKNLCVWNKNSGGMGSLYRSKHELVFVYKNGTASHINNVELGKHGRYRTNVWDYAGVNSFGSNREDLELHPTVKPVAMIADAIMDVSNRNDIVLDCFLGSGSTLLACEKTARICRGIEYEPKYIDVTIKRWQELTGKEAINLSNSNKTYNELKKEKENSDKQIINND